MRRCAFKRGSGDQRLADEALGTGKSDAGRSEMYPTKSVFSRTAALAWWLRRPPPQRQTRDFDSRLLHGDFSGSGHTSDFKTGAQVVTLPGAWRYRVSAGTGWPGVSIQ